MILIFWAMGVLLGLTALLVVLRFMKKKPPSRDMAAEKARLMEKARRDSASSDPEGSFRNRGGGLQ